jgi:hypothetical protein
MKCAPCTIYKDPLLPVPEAVTQINGTLVCSECAQITADDIGAMQRDPVLRARRHERQVMRRQGDRP